MALRRRLVLGVCTLLCLLCVYTLCVHLDSPMSFSIEPLRRIAGNIQAAASVYGQSEESSPDRKGNTDPHTPTAQAQTFTPPPTQKPKGPTQKPVQPIQKPKGPTPKPKGPTPKPKGPTPKPKGPTPKPKGPTPKPKGPTPKPKGPTPKPKGPTQKPKGPTQKPKGPTESPFIGDSYMSDDLPPLTDCPDSIRAHISLTDFGARFLAHIPVVQASKHVSQQLYQRLSKYGGAYGWAGLDYPTLVETLPLLNSSANERLLDDWPERRDQSACVRCAVVGNGGILKNSSRGAEIDGHHYVLRVNGAILKGFEKDIGSRTTHYTFSTNTMMNSMRSYGGLGFRGPPTSNETRYVFLPEHDRDYLLMKAAVTHTKVERGRDKGADPTKYFGEDVSVEKLKMYHPDFVRYLRNRFLQKTKYKSYYRPSTGAMMLLAAIHTCDQVSAYGFMTPDYNKYSDHYYDNKFHKVGFYANHDLKMEMSLWQQLHQAGLIRLYMHKE